jgi:hypothetical protein
VRRREVRRRELPRRVKPQRETRQRVKPQETGAPHGKQKTTYAIEKTENDIGILFRSTADFSPRLCCVNISFYNGVWKLTLALPQPLLPRANPGLNTRAV